jgi:hypothetical protein
MSGATIYATLALANFTASGAIGTAATTVDAKTMFNINQTTSNITLSLPNPTDTTAGRIAYVNNVGTTSFFFLGTQIVPGNSRTAIWNGTAWKLTGNSDDRGATAGNSRKTADETVTNSAVVQNDDHLSFPITAGDTWLFQINGTVRNGATNNLRLRMQVPGAPTNCSATASASYNGSSVTNAACNTDLILTSINNWPTAASDQFSYVWVFTTNTTGIAQFQWAQGTAAALGIVIAKDTILSIYRISGADLAEVYYSVDNDAVAWDIVSLTGDGVSQVEKSGRAYDSRALGVISTKPGLVMGEADGSGKPVIVGLAGRVPVKVTTKNGIIKPGDYITTSDIPGVGMKATEAGRVIGKALTWYSWEEQGTLMVFIQNTYFDGFDDAEYATSLSGGLGFNPAALDRFSFMVKKSLGKIDPNYGSGSGTSSSGSLDTVGMAVSTLTNSMSELSSQISSLSWALSDANIRIALIQSSQIAIWSSSGNTDTIAPVIPSTVISSEDQSALDMILGTAESLMIQGKTIFLETVRFTQTVIFEKAVIFRSLVTFESRVIFGDSDMGGSARISAGNTTTHIEFDSPYDETPVITITPVDHYVAGRVTHLSRTGFDIEVSSSASASLRFNWIALLIRGGQVQSTDVPVDAPLPLPSVDLSPSPPVVSGEVSPTWSGSTTSNSGVALPPVLIDTDSSTSTNTGSSDTPSEPSVAPPEDPVMISVSGEAIPN